jgi:hypothetical protein
MSWSRRPGRRRPMARSEAPTAPPTTTPAARVAAPETIPNRVAAPVAERDAVRNAASPREVYRTTNGWEIKDRLAAIMKEYTVKATAKAPNPSALRARATRMERSRFVPLDTIWSARFQVARPAN